MINKRGHGNGKRNHRTWNYKINPAIFYEGCDHEWKKAKLPGHKICMKCTKLVEDKS